MGEWEGTLFILKSFIPCRFKYRCVLVRQCTHKIENAFVPSMGKSSTEIAPIISHTVIKNKVGSDIKSGHSGARNQYHNNVMASLVQLHPTCHTDRADTSYAKITETTTCDYPNPLSRKYTSAKTYRSGLAWNPATAIRLGFQQHRRAKPGMDEEMRFDLTRENVLFICNTVCDKHRRECAFLVYLPNNMARPGIDSTTVQEPT